MGSSTMDASESMKALNDRSVHTPLDGSLLALRSFRLQAFKQAKLHHEVKQPAIFSSKKAAVLHMLPHVFAFLVAVTLIVLNLFVVYVGPLSSTALTALQFAAKVLELLIVGSITAIMLALVRNSLLGNGPFPFGAVSAPYKVHDLSYLWSLEFWGSCKARNVPLWTKIIVRVLIPTMITLAALTGPASAVLLIPRVIDYPVGNNMYLLNGSDIRFPRVVDLSDGIIMDEADLVQIMSQNLLGAGSGGWPTSDTKPLWKSTAVPDNTGARYAQMASYRNSSYSEDQSIDNLTYVTAFPNKLVGTAAGDTFRSCKGHGYQPYISKNWFRLRDTDPVLVERAETEYVHFEGKPYLNNLISYSELFPNSTAHDTAVKRYLNLGLDPDDETDLTWHYISNETNWNQSQPLMTFMWRSLPDTVSNHSVVFVSGVSEPPFTKWAVGAETMDARWVKVDAQSSGGYSSTQDLREVFGFSTESMLITLEPRWLAHLFDLGFQNSSVVTLGQSTTYASHLETLAPYIAIALSTIPSDTRLDASSGRRIWEGGKFLSSGYGFSTTSADYDAIKQYIEDSGLTHGYDAVVGPLYTVQDPDNMAQVAVSFSVRTYGYDAATVTVKLSLAFMILYALLSGLFVVHSLWTSQTSTSWDTVTEIIALALNSKKPKDLDGTSVAIGTADTCKQTLNIRVNDRGSLEMVFHGNNGSAYDIVIPNERYE